VSTSRSTFFENIANFIVTDGILRATIKVEGAQWEPVEDEVK
jgi:hypothetical protein